MFAKVRKCFMAFSLSFLFLTFTGGPVFSTLYTLDAKSDAGLSVSQTTYVNYVSNINGAVLGSVDPVSIPMMTTSQQVYDYGYAHAFFDYKLESAGNIWSSNPSVGLTVPLPAGTYRISVVDGGFTYDSFGWSGTLADRWLWGMNIAGPSYGTWLGRSDGPSDNPYLYDSQAAALQANLGRYVDIGLATPGSLKFWINDVNSIDNSGSLTFSITAVPAPPSLLLLAGGIPFLFVSRVRKYLMRLG